MAQYSGPGQGGAVRTGVHSAAPRTIRSMDACQCLWQGKERTAPQSSPSPAVFVLTQPVLQAQPLASPEQKESWTPDAVRGLLGLVLISDIMTVHLGENFGHILKTLKSTLLLTYFS